MIGNIFLGTSHYNIVVNRCLCLCCYPYVNPVLSLSCFCLMSILTYPLIFLTFFSISYSYVLFSLVLNSGLSFCLYTYLPCCLSLCLSLSVMLSVHLSLPPFIVSLFHFLHLSSFPSYSYLCLTFISFYLTRSCPLDHLWLQSMSFVSYYKFSVESSLIPDTSLPVFSVRSFVTIDSAYVLAQRNLTNCEEIFNWVSVSGVTRLL